MPANTKRTSDVGCGDAVTERATPRASEPTDDPDIRPIPIVWLSSILG
jgi:hypothetical protein